MCEYIFLYYIVFYCLENDFLDGHRPGLVWAVIGSVGREARPTPAWLTADTRKR